MEIWKKMWVGVFSEHSVVLVVHYICLNPEPFLKKRNFISQATDGRKDGPTDAKMDGQNCYANFGHALMIECERAIETRKLCCYCCSARNTARSEGNVSKWLDAKV